MGTAIRGRGSITKEDVGAVSTGLWARSVLTDRAGRNLVAVAVRKRPHGGWEGIWTWCEETRVAVRMESLWAVLSGKSLCHGPPPAPHAPYQGHRVRAGEGVLIPIEVKLMQ